MSAELVAVGSVLKWLVGLVLAPWLWHERKLRESLQRQLDKGYFNKSEVKEQIELRNKPIIDKLDLIYQELVASRKH